MKKNKIVIMLMIFLFCVIPKNISYAKTKIPEWASTGKIAHAGGGLNSVEALKQTLKEKRKVVELDFKFIQDGTLVCLHRWSDIGGEKLDKNEFLSSKLMDEFTPMTAETALKMLIEDGNTYLVVDAKEQDIIKVYEEINRLCLEYDKQHENAEAITITNTTTKKGRVFRKKIIPQIYQKSEYEKLKNIYNYKNWIFTVYRLNPESDKEFKSLAKFCKKNGIKTMAVPKNTITKRIVKILQKQQLTVAIHTVNSKAKQKKFYKMGVDIIYTDFL